MSFLETELDARLIVEACRVKQLPFCTRSPRESPSLNGSILAYDCEASGDLDWNTSLWTFEKSDGPFKLWNLIGDIEMKKKQAIIVHHHKTYRLISYYRQWESLTGAFIPPTRCECFTLFYEGRFGGARIRVAAKDLQVLEGGEQEDPTLSIDICGSYTPVGYEFLAPEID